MLIALPVYQFNLLTLDYSYFIIIILILYPLHIMILVSIMLTISHRYAEYGIIVITSLNSILNTYCISVGYIFIINNRILALIITLFFLISDQYTSLLVLILAISSTTQD
jgi:hypothetical protein